MAAGRSRNQTQLPLGRSRRCQQAQVRAPEASRRHLEPLANDRRVDRERPPPPTARSPASRRSTTPAACKAPQSARRRRSRRRIVRANSRRRAHAPPALLALARGLSPRSPTNDGIARTCHSRGNAGCLSQQSTAGSTRAGHDVRSRWGNCLMSWRRCSSRPAADIHSRELVGAVMAPDGRASRGLSRFPPFYVQLARVEVCLLTDLRRDSR
jgi:hypothetical protein